MSYRKVCGQKLTCGSCRYLEKDRLFKEPCVVTGRITSSKACTHYSPDAFRLVNSPDRIDQVLKFAETVNGMSAGDLMILAGLILRVRHLKKYGYKFFQKVYIRVNLPVNQNYLSNFAVGYLVDATQDWVRIVSSDENYNVCSYTLMNDKNSQSFYTLDKFNPIRKQMFESQAFVAPEVPTFSKKVIRGEIPTIDEVDAVGGVDYNLRGKRKIKKEAKDDLVSAITRMQRGFLKTIKSSKSSSIDQSVEISWS